MTKAIGGHQVPPDLQETVRRMLKRDGEHATAAALKISRQTLARCAAGLPVQLGTIALLREQIGRAGGGT